MIRLTREETQGSGERHRLSHSVLLTIISLGAGYQQGREVGFQRKLTILIDDFKAAIRAKNYSKKTFEAYWPHVVDFLKFCRVGSEWRRPEQLGSEDVTRYLTMLAVKRNVSASTVSPLQTLLG